MTATVVIVVFGFIVSLVSVTNRDSRYFLECH